MDVNEIYDCAAGLLGTELAAVEQSVLEGCCAGALVACTARLRQGMDEETIRPVLVQAAGMLAASMMVQTQAGENVQSFTAGKLSVTTRTGSDRGTQLRQCAESLLAPYTAGDFAFLGVRG